MKNVVIVHQNEGKGRAFHALCLAAIEADTLWDGGQTSTDTMRPVWAMFAGSEQELRPFMANVTTGRKVMIQGSSRKEERMEFLRSAGYRVAWQREAEGSIATVFLPEIFELDPGMVDVKGAAFVVLPTESLLRSQRIETTRAIVQHALKFKPPVTPEKLEALVPMAFLFCAYLDRRTRCPILSDERFYLQFMLACLHTGLASWPGDDSYRWRDETQNWGRHGKRLVQHWTEKVGIGDGIAFHADHAQIEELLASQTTRFFQVSRGN